MFWTKVAQFGPPGTPQKSAFFQESGRKRMKEWHQVTFTKEWMNALDDTRILAPTHFQNLVSFPRYGRLKKKCWYKLICNGTYWLLLTGHFGLVFIRPSQWSITAVRGRWTFPFDPVPGLQYTCLIWNSLISIQHFEFFYPRTISHTHMRDCLMTVNNPDFVFNTRGPFML